MKWKIKIENYYFSASTYRYNKINYTENSGMTPLACLWASHKYKECTLAQHPLSHTIQLNRNMIFAEREMAYSDVLSD